MHHPTSQPDAWEADLRRGAIRVAALSAAYVVTMAAAVFGPMSIWSGNATLTVSAIILNLIVGVLLILGAIRHVMDLDEMMQRIQLEATGLALGFGVVGGLTYSVLDITNTITWDAEIGFLVIAMSVVYLIGLAAGLRRTR